MSDEPNEHDGHTIDVGRPTHVDGKPLPPAPITVPCEGSGCPTHESVPDPLLRTGMCQMCGRTVLANSTGIAHSHDRPDILAMIERGDFDE